MHFQVTFCLRSSLNITFLLLEVFIFIFKKLAIYKVCVKYIIYEYSTLLPSSDRSGTIISSIDIGSSMEMSLNNLHNVALISALFSEALFTLDSIDKRKVQSLQCYRHVLNSASICSI